MIEPGIYKDVMSSFPSGVTVVTTLDPDGGIVGITASAFSALSAICCPKVGPTLVLSKPSAWMPNSFSSLRPFFRAERVYSNSSTEYELSCHE